MKKYWIKWQNLVVIFLLGIFLLLNFLSAQKESLTYDEPVHLQAGVEEWQTKKFSLDANNPPLVRELSAVPVVLGIKPARQYLVPRMVITFLSAVLGFLVFKYAEKNFGFKVGLFSLLLFVFEPNILAHSHYVTLDMGTALFFFLGFLAGEKFAENQNWGNAFVFGIASGLTFAAKITIIPAFLLTFAILFWVKRKKLNSDFWQKIALCLLVCLMTVWACYFFTFSPIVAEREDANRLSVKIINFAEEKNLLPLKQAIFWLKLKPVPLGYFLATIKNGLVYNLTNFSSPTVKNLPFNQPYLLPAILFLKVPLVLWFLMAIGLVKKNNRFLLIPLFFLVLIFSLSKASPRVRYLLPVFPFLIIIAAKGANWLWQKEKLGKILLIVGLLVYIVQTISFFPHFISFTNSGMILPDSNGDWGQSLPDLKDDLIKKKNIAQMRFSYFGTDRPENYGLVADRPFGEKFEERCPLYLIKVKEEGEKIVAISLSNYYYCDYYRKPEFAKEKIADIVGKAILIFKE